MRFIRSAALAAAALVAFSAQSLAQSLPAAPQVTMGADLKVMRFDWEPVAGTHFYRLWVKPGGTRYISVGPRIPASITHAEHIIPVHLTDWERTRYVVTACNAAGCSHSAALNPRNLMLDTIGYLKASNTDAVDHFGREVALSDDGLTLLVSAEHEGSGASGVNGDQADNSSGQSGAVYVFRRTGAGWRQDAYLKPPVNRPGIRFGSSVVTLSLRAMALNAMGTIAVIAAPAQDAANFAAAGEVYVFRRSSSGWSHSATLRAPEPQEFDHFGYSLDLSLDGNTLRVNSRKPRDSEGNYEGRTHIYDRSGSSWVHKITLAPFYAGDFCPSVRMSGDGRTLVSSCFSLGVDGIFPSEFRAVTLKRSGDTWVHAGDLALTRYNSERSVALNFDATRMALGQTQSSGPRVDVFRWEGSAWVSEAKLFVPDVLASSPTFGRTLAFDREGQRLAIGDDSSTAGGAGVSRTVTAGTAEHGAVFVHERNGALPAPWTLRSVVKAPNPAVDAFGLSMAMSGSGRTLAVGAMLEDSNARGIDGDQSNNSAPDAGAAYLY